MTGFGSQICLSASRKTGSPVPASNASPEDRDHAKDAFYSVISQYTEGGTLLPYELRYLCPHPILGSEQLSLDLEKYNQALTLALTNIVSRWFTDKDAAFPARMPLEPHEEQLLQWFDQQVENNVAPAYEGHQGHWRPDFLLPADSKEGFKICEINSRFPFCGIDLAAWIYKALDDHDPDTKSAFLEPAGDFDVMYGALFEMFNPTLPIRLLMARQSSPMYEAFMNYTEKKTGMRPRPLAPEDLRLVPDPASKTGFTLHCANPASDIGSPEKAKGENLERIHQVGVQLFLDESGSLDPQLRQNLALHGVNDIRSSLLVHDKRLLGVLQQELDELVTKHHILTPEQADILRNGTVPTIIPGSEELRQLTDSYRQGRISKDDYILKPVRGARGAGILFGDELGVSEWESILDSLQNPEIRGNRPLYVVQRLVNQMEEDLFLDEEIGVQRCQRVGAYHVVNGKFRGLGTWRTAVVGQRTCNMATGAAWKLGSMIQSQE